MDQSLDHRYEEFLETVANMGAIQPRSLSKDEVHQLILREMFAYVTGRLYEGEKEIKRIVKETTFSELMKDAKQHQLASRSIRKYFFYHIHASTELRALYQRKQ